jgi:uncharacterized protein YegL
MYTSQSVSHVSSQRSMHTQAHRNVSSGFYRPSCVCRNVRQRVGLARDSSDSMSEGTKAPEATEACRGLIAELANPINKDGFEVLVVDFNHTARIAAPLAPASEVGQHLAAIAPDGCTDIAGVLRLMRTELEQATDDPGGAITYLRPVCILFSDGRHNSGPHPRDEATRLKALADLVTVAFGTDADEAMLRDLASSPQHYVRCHDGRHLNTFLARVGKTLTQVRTASAGTTHYGPKPLTSIHRD